MLSSSHEKSHISQVGTIFFFCFFISSKFLIILLFSAPTNNNIHKCCTAAFSPSFLFRWFLSLKKTQDTVGKASRGIAYFFGVCLLDCKNTCNVRLLIHLALLQQQNETSTPPLTKHNHLQFRFL